MFNDTTARISAMWPFPMPSIPGELIEAFGDHSDRLPHGLYDLAAKWSDDERDALFDGPGGMADEAWEELACEAHNNNVRGYICIGDCPVFSRSGTGASYSWGHYRSRSFFAPTADEAVTKAVEWAEAEYRAVTASADAA